MLLDTEDPSLSLSALEKNKAALLNKSAVKSNCISDDKHWEIIGNTYHKESQCQLSDIIFQCVAS